MLKTMLPGITIGVMDDGATADGAAQNTILVRVTAQNGRPQGGLPLSFHTDDGARMLTRDAVTNEFGIARAAVVSSRAGVYTVTALVDDDITLHSTLVTFVKRRAGLRLALLGALVEPQSREPVRDSAPEFTLCPCRRWFAQMKYD